MSDLVPQGPDDAPALYVAFQVGGTDYALPAASVRQLETFTEATAVPGAPPFVRGIVQIRGRVVPLVDLRARFGLPEVAPDDAERRVIVGEHGDRLVGLLVDRAREVLKIAPSQLRPPPRILDEGAGGFVSTIAHVGTRIVMVLDFPRIIGEELVDGG